MRLNTQSPEAAECEEGEEDDEQDGYTHSSHDDPHQVCVQALAHGTCTIGHPKRVILPEQKE